MSTEGPATDLAPADAAAGQLLTARGLRAAYGPTVAVDDVALTVGTGEVLGIAGESGCGKSTLAAVLSLTARPPLTVLGGDLTVDGQHLDLAGRPPRTWRGGVVSLLPQGAMNALSATARVGDMAVDVVRAHRGRVPRSVALDLLADRLDALDLPRRVIGAYPHQLSGGMRQRVVTVLSTLLDPRLLIADEPTSALDVSTQRALVELLRELVGRGLVGGIVFVTHDLPVLRAVADRIAVMYAGRIVETGPTAALVDDPRHPYTAALLSSVLVPEPQVRRRRIGGIRGAPPDLADPPAGCRFRPRCSLATDACTDDPPAVGDPDRYATCWWTRDHPDERLEPSL
ncbi:ABC transporter ATP-binding protein [Actinocatenispora rupis]|uniref:Peptide ABC transporter ATP-binding protein n=1 Tax=Actinocatenispora rupis TaxID=519421 RepID=A0A8J3NCK9_9ACTN|nr:ABC transporter ATP-binding protein [Actinocatenispora rupis]GID12005.1 peptide ABC transporter ATP-binding protein [Actinocatenispora rupis]